MSTLPTEQAIHLCWKANLKWPGILLSIWANGLVNFAVSLLTPRPPKHIEDLVNSIRMPRAAFAKADAGRSHH